MSVMIVRNNASLFLGNISLRALAKRFGTPLYAYDAGVIRERARELRASFPGTDIYYAAKANTNPHLVRLIHAEGCGIETVSAGEIAIARKAGVSRKALSFTCSNVTADELAFAARHAATVHLDSLGQLEAWGKRKLGKEVSLRINHGLGAGHHAHVITGGPESKFGIGLGEVKRALALARTYGVRITGVHQHIGSNVLDAKMFLKAADAILASALLFPDLRSIDIGGGIGVPYQPSQRRLDLASLGVALQKRFEIFRKAYGRSVTFAMEPGRYLVAEAGVLLVAVTDVKKTSVHTFVGVNSGFNHLIRPAMYGSYHEIVPVRESSERKVPVTIAGNICESGDIFAWDRPMPLPAVGDLLAIRNAGAYGYTMASRYNSRPLPPEVLVQNGKARLVRKRQ